MIIRAFRNMIEEEVQKKRDLEPELAVDVKTVLRETMARSAA